MKSIILKSFCFVVICLMFAGCEKRFGEGVVLKDIEITQPNLRVHIGTAGRLYAYPVPYDCTDYNFTWRSGTPDIVTVDGIGNIMATNFGTGKIYVSQDGKFEKEFTLEIYETTLLEKLQTLNPKGFWNFMDPDNLFKAVIGNVDLVPSEASVGEWEQVNGYNNRTKAIRTVPNVRNTNDPTLTLQKHLIYNHKWGDTPGTQGGVNEYTILIDACFPGASGGFLSDAGAWTNGQHFSILQVDPNNRNEPGLFFRNNGEWGFRGCYTPNQQFQRERWYRFVMCVKVGKEIRYFLNNIKSGPNDPNNVTGNQNNGEGAHGTWRGSADGTPPVYFFASRINNDDNGTADRRMHVASLAVWDRALTDEEVRTIGSIPIY